jgi:signal transduction histidine kinase
MKKITGKVLFSLFLAFFITTFIPRIIFRIFDIENPDSGIITDNQVFFPVLIIVGIALTIFMILIDRQIVRRIKVINSATERVAQGDFDVKLDTKGKDELSSLSEHFNVMVDELKSNEYLNKSFVGNFSHEFKTPITAIKGYSDLIVEGDLTSEEIKEYSSIISKESERLSNLAKNMLQLSILDASPITKKQDTYNVSEQIRGVLKLFNLEWEKKQIEMDVELGDITILNNEELTYHIWKNLIDNAIKYTPNNSSVSINLDEKDKSIYFSVKNHGVGLTEDQKTHIFDMFYSVNHLNQEKGSGIGLSIVSKIIEKLNGSITVNSDGSSFVEFSVELPNK